MDFVESGTFYNYFEKDTDFTKLDGELWRVIDPDKEPTKWSISINFKKVKKRGFFKDKSVDGVEVTFTRNGSEQKNTFFIDELPDNFSVRFDE